MLCLIFFLFREDLQQRVAALPQEAVSNPVPYKSCSYVHGDLSSCCPAAGEHQALWACGLLPLPRLCMGGTAFRRRFTKMWRTFRSWKWMTRYKYNLFWKEKATKHGNGPGTPTPIFKSELVDLTAWLKKGVFVFNVRGFGRILVRKLCSYFRGPLSFMFWSTQLKCKACCCCWKRAY